MYFLKVSMMRAPPSWAVDSPLLNSTLNLPDLPKDPIITPVSPLAVTTCSTVLKTCLHSMHISLVKIPDAHKAIMLQRCIQEQTSMQLYRCCMGSTRMW